MKGPHLLSGCGSSLHSLLSLVCTALNGPERHKNTMTVERNLRNPQRAIMSQQLQAHPCLPYYVPSHKELGSPAAGAGCNPRRSLQAAILVTGGSSRYVAATDKVGCRSESSATL